MNIDVYDIIPRDPDKVLITDIPNTATGGDRGWDCDVLEFKLKSGDLYWAVWDFLRAPSPYSVDCANVAPKAGTADRSVIGKALELKERSWFLLLDAARNSILLHSAASPSRSRATSPVPSPSSQSYSPSCPPSSPNTCSSASSSLSSSFSTGYSPPSPCCNSTTSAEEESIYPPTGPFLERHQSYDGEEDDDHRKKRRCCSAEWNVVPDDEHRKASSISYIKDHYHPQLKDACGQLSNSLLCEEIAHRILSVASGYAELQSRYDKCISNEQSLLNEVKSLRDSESLVKQELKETKIRLEETEEELTRAVRKAEHENEILVREKKRLVTELEALKSKKKVDSKRKARK